MATQNDLTFKNQYGEPTVADVQTVSVPLVPSQANNTILANISGGAAVPAAATTQAVSNRLPAKAGVSSIVAIATADAPVQGVAYVQADVQAIATLANANKAKINEILAALKVVS